MDETFEPMELETARTLRKYLIGLLLQELELVALARGEPRLSKQDADHFVELMLERGSENTAGRSELSTIELQSLLLVAVAGLLVVCSEPGLGVQNR
jgi:hypothetical protein